MGHKVGHKVGHGLHHGLGHGLPHVLSTPVFTHTINAAHAEYRWFLRYEDIIIFYQHYDSLNIRKKAAELFRKNVFSNKVNKVKMPQ